MYKIVKHGKAVYKRICSNCDCVYEYDTEYIFELKDRLCTYCPECNKENPHIQCDYVGTIEEYYKNEKSDI